MKTKSNLLGIVIIALIITSSVSSLVNFSNAGGPNASYTITLDTINDKLLTQGPFSSPITIEGTASGTNFIGQLFQYHVEVTWGDGITEVIPDWVSLTQNGDDFQGVWAITHYYTAPGSYSITVKLFHSQPPGAGGTSDATYTGTGIGVSSTTSLSLSLSSPQVVGTSITATSTVLPSQAPGTLQFQVQTPGTTTWTTFDTKTLTGNPLTSVVYTLAPSTGTYKFRAVYSGDANYEASTSPEISMVVNPTLYVSLSPSSATINPGETQLFTATPNYGSGTYTNYAWYVDSNPIANTGQTYSFTSNTAGIHSISVTVTDSLSNTATASASCTVNAGVLDHITISPMTATIFAGQSQTYSAEGFDSYGNNLGPVAATYIASLGATVNGNLVSANQIGTYTVTATYDGKTSPQATLTVIAGGAGSVSYFVVVASPSSVVAGGSVSVTVTAKDQYGNTVPSYVGTAGLVCSDVQAVLPASVDLVAGVGSFSVTLRTVGSQTVTATAGSVTGTSNAVSVTPGGAGSVSYFVVVASPSSVVAGGSVSVTVTAKDQYGNTVPSYVGTAGLVCSDVQAVLPASVDLVAGVGSFSVTLRTVGSQTVTATAGSVTGTSNAVSVTPGGAGSVSYFVVVASPSSVVAGGSVSVTVTAKDQYGNTVPSYVGTAGLVCSDVQAVLPASVDLVAGVGSFSVTLRTVGSQTVTATAGSVTGTSNAVSVTPGDSSSVSYFVVEGPSSQATAGVGFSITVTAKDAYGNTVPAYVGTIGFDSNDTDVGVNLPSDYTFVGSDNGVHTFDNIILITGGSQRISVSDGSKTGYTYISIVASKISGYVFNDINANGIRETAEVGLAGWTVKLNGTITITTDSTGYYEFTNLPQANYVITETTKSGWILTSQSDITLSILTGQTYNDNNFGNVEATTVIRGIVFNDANSDGFKDVNEPGLGGWTLNLNGAVNVTTDNNGFFAFIITSPPSICLVKSYDEAGWRPTTPSIINVQTQSGGLYEIEFGKTNQADVAAIYGYVFNDINGNGIWDNTELGLTGWTVNITQGSNKIVTTTGPQGFYIVTLETAGYYTVSTSAQAGWRATAPEMIVVYTMLGENYQVDFAYQNPTIDHITIEPKTATVNAGIAQQFTATATDTYGNSWTVIASYSSNSVDVFISGNAAYSNKAGTYTVTATYGGKTDTATLTVIGHLPDANTISISPKTSQITAGTTQAYTATASDAYGNIWDVTSSTIFSIQTGAEGSWSNNIYTSAKAGNWIVTCNYQTTSDTATLTVTHSDDPAKLASLSLSPASASVAAGLSQSYVATATDTYGNSWTVTASTTFSIDLAAGGSWNGATYTAEKAGVWTVTGIYLSTSATATLTVTHSDDPAKLNYITIAPKLAEINVGATQSYSATAYDTFGNSWAVSAIYSCPNPNLIISANTARSNIAGSFQITGSFGGKTDSATLTVIGHLPTIISINITPNMASVAAGRSQKFTATASDGFVTWEVTNQVTWVISPEAGGSWTQLTGTYTSQIAGTWIVKATLEQLSATATLQVYPNREEISQIIINPKSAITKIGFPQSFTVAAYDRFGNKVGDITEYATFSSPGTSIFGNTVTANNAGTYIVTASYLGLTDTATLTVTGSSMTFKSEGLPLGTNWTISFDGKDYYSTTDQIIITDLTGAIYLWSTPETIVQGQIRFNANQTSGSVLLTQASTQTIKYTTQYLVTFTSTGNTIPVTMPPAEWVNANGSATGVFPTTVQNSQNNTRATYMGDNRTQTITSPTTITATYQTQYLVNYQTTGNGLPATVPADQWVNSGENATGTFPSQIVTQNTRCNLLGDNRTTIVQPTTVLANYQTQYYITISSAHGTLSQQSQWVNAGSNLAVSVTSPDGDTGHRYVALGYSIDGNPTISGTAYQFTNIQASHSIQFVWQEQYYLTVNSPYGTTIGAGWYNAGATATASLSSPIVLGGSGTQYVFTNWSGDASGSSTTSNQITMNAPKTASANWKTQYYLTVNSVHGNPSGQGWYDSGSSATISISSTVDNGAARYIFKGWSGNGYIGIANTAQIQINGPTTQTALWQTQYLVSYKATGNAISISMPADEWINSGEIAKGQFTTTVTNSANDTRCLLLSDNRPSSITKPTEITANYQTQYLVQFDQEGIKSDAVGLILTLEENGYNYLQMPTAIWLNNDVEITFNYTFAVASTGFGTQYILTDVNATSPLTISAPTQIKAIYESQTSLFTVAGTALLLFLLLLLALLIIAARRRKKKKQEQNANAVSQPSTPAL